MYINEKLKRIWHGCDYNPDQWLDYPEVLKKDIELMKKAGCNVMSIGIFSWAALEPEEGVFNFGWLDGIIDNLYKNGIYTILATPSGAMPAWMAEKYPEIKRMSDDGIRNRFGNRHNCCYSSPVYREKVKIMNTKLAERYGKHPAILMWHISNEYNIQDCHCPLCCENFRKWLEKKYVTIENLNKRWWSGFWAHTYNNFSQIDPPGKHGEQRSNPLRLEWQRFRNHMLESFIENEVSSVRKINPDIPVTTNFQHLWDMDYHTLADKLDIISWDNYPLWHSDKNEFTTAADAAMFHSLYNSLKKDKPFMLMESTPYATCWQDVSKLRRPGMHHLASLQAVAHGSDTVQYFQWRKSRGQVEQFHGAVVGHDNSDDTRTFREVAEVGATLEKISEITGTLTKNEAAILFDYDSLWSLTIAEAYRNIDDDKGFEKILVKNFGALWQLNVGCDFVFPDEDFSKYKVIAAPMLFMMKNGLKEKLEEFVRNGGIFVSTFISGIVDEDGLTFFDDNCYPLRKLLGVKAEETDSLYDGQYKSVSLFGNTYKCEKYCELAYAEGSEVLGEYLDDFYKGFPAVTVNKFGKGKAYYIACDFEVDGYIALYKNIIHDVLASDKIIESPENVSVTMRYGKDAKYIFVMNFNNDEKHFTLPDGCEILAGELKDNKLAPYGVVILKTSL